MISQKGPVQTPEFDAIFIQLYGRLLKYLTWIEPGHVPQYFVCTSCRVQITDPNRQRHQPVSQRLQQAVRDGVAIQAKFVVQPRGKTMLVAEQGKSDHLVLSDQSFHLVK